MNSRVQLEAENDQLRSRVNSLRKQITEVLALIEQVFVEEGTEAEEALERIGYLLRDAMNRTGGS